MKKTILKNFFPKIQHGGFKVVYWDGEEINYGDAPPNFKLIFNQAPPTAFNLDDPIVALGEAYMDEIIDYEGNLEDILFTLDRNAEYITVNETVKVVFKTINSIADKLEQKQNIQHHYDLGNNFFSLWLDKTMSYSCAYFKKSTDSLYQAQIQKIEHILKKLIIKPGERLLDIGSGWGHLIIKAAKEYGAKSLGITLSEEQYKKTNERIIEENLQGQVEVQLINYLDLDEEKYQFDKIASIGMFEHVGKENLPKYMDKVSNLLAGGGLCLLHTITHTTEDTPSNIWIKKYIFPGGYVPSLRETIWLLPERNLHLIHLESLRMHYAMTLEHWHKNFSGHLDEVRKMFDQRFIRMWSLYLQGCAASFKSSGIDVHQLLFSKGLNNNLPFTYGHLYK